MSTQIYSASIGQLPASGHAGDAQPASASASSQRRSVQDLIANDALHHHVEFLNPHTHEYQPNYVSHAALAMLKAGAGIDAIRLRVAQESRMLQPLTVNPLDPAATSLSSETWTSARGKGPEHYASLAAFFYKEILAKGSDAVIKFYLPQLLSGMTLHSLVHLGAGVVNHIDVMIAQGLAMWTYSYRQGPELPAPVADDWDKASVLDVLQDVQEDARLQRILDAQWGNMEWHKRVRRCTKPEIGAILAELLASWTLPYENVDAAKSQLADAVVLLAATAGRAYPAGMDLPLAQTLLAVAALDSLLPLLAANEVPVAMRHSLRLVMSVYLSQGCPALHPTILDHVYPARVAKDIAKSVPGGPAAATTPAMARVASQLSSMEGGGSNGGASETETDGESEIPHRAFCPIHTKSVRAEWERLCNAPPYDDIYTLQALFALRQLAQRRDVATQILFLRAAKRFRDVAARGAGWELRGSGNGVKESFIVDGGQSEQEA